MPRLAGWLPSWSGSKKNLASTVPRAKRLALLEREAPELPLKTQAELLSLSRSSLYYQPVPVSAEEIALKHAMDEIYTRYPFYGSRRVTVELRQNRQIKVARETVQRYMREMGTLAPHRKCRCRWHLSRAKPVHLTRRRLSSIKLQAAPTIIWLVSLHHIALVEVFLGLNYV